MRKFFCVAMSLIFALLAVSCSASPVSTTASGSETIPSSAVSETTSGTTAETAAEESIPTSETEKTATTEAASTSSETTVSEEQTSADDPEPPVVTESGSDTQYIDIGEFVTLMYNPDYCEIKAEVTQGLGSRENVTVTITMKDEYEFSGWTFEDLIPNLEYYVASAEKKTSLSAAEKEKLTNYKKYLSDLSRSVTFTFTASEDLIPSYSSSSRILLIPNISVRIQYLPNLGVITSGAKSFYQTYNVSLQRCPSTVPDQGQFTREGYTLLEYNTEPDGSGYSVSPGSRVPMFGKGSLTLYCIWAKWTDAGEFSCLTQGSTLVLDGYLGSSETVVVPASINGKKVTEIGAYFLEDNDTVKTVILPNTIQTVDNNAFVRSSIEKLVFFDNLSAIYDEAFSGCESFTSIQINAVLNLHNYYLQSTTTFKLDRMVYALNSDKKKLIIYGGSGTLYGFDSSQIDEALNNDYIVVNLGSNANISSAFYFDWMDDFLGEGDVILWAPEAGEKVLGDTATTWYMFSMSSGHYDIFRSIDVSNYSGIFSSYTAYTAQHVNAQVSFDVCNINNSAYGDSTSARSHQKEGSVYASSYNRCAAYFGRGLYDYQASLISSLTKKGVKVLHTYAAMDKNSASFADTSWLASYEKAMKAQFPELIYISDYTVSLMDTKMMSDSEWHLTWAGAVARTGALVPYLVAALK